MSNNGPMSKLVQSGALLVLLGVPLDLAGKLRAAEEPAAEAAAMLVEPQELHARLSEPRLRILDVRPAEKYDAGHVPGAVRVDVAAWYAQSHLPDGLHDTAFWAEAVGQLGSTAQSRVVVYGDPLPNAARVWWLLRYVGLEDVALVNGGLKAWSQVGLPTATEAPSVAPSTFKPHFQAERLGQIDDLLSPTGSADSRPIILDARSPGEYTGDVKRGPRGGHIPGAVNLEWIRLIAPDGRFKPRDELLALLQSCGADPDSVVIAHCQSGGRASVEVFALELAGYRNVKNYYLGWKEWGAAEEAPVETPQP